MRKKVLLAALVLSFGGLLLAQKEDWEVQRLFQDIEKHRQPPQETEFVFARIQFTSHGPGRRNYGSMRSCMPDSAPYGFARVCGWAHDYPAAEENILQITREATRLNVTKESYVMARLESDEIFKYPWGLMSEVGEMTLSDREVVNLREYLNRGGFIMADDFDGDSLEWFQGQMRKVFPNRNFVELTLDHPIFHTFYDIPTLDIDPPYRQRGTPKFYGYYDDHGRLTMVLNHNNDLGDFFEWIDEVRYPLPASTAGLRFGLNYFMYALTH